ncbi:hypothetical protein VTL71DRAFT_1789 [Oculimacula yallundae]|uniref:Secreted protein n=1 Tax=Oculimacula yallundae TaxID=86028 RepID=A0ABR4CBT6_9HELO
MRARMHCTHEMLCLLLSLTSCSFQAQKKAFSCTDYTVTHPSIHSSVGLAFMYPHYFYRKSPSPPLMTRTFRQARLYKENGQCTP